MAVATQPGLRIGQCFIILYICIKAVALALPLNSSALRIQAAVNSTSFLDSLPVTNFQDMSAILSLLAADTVEKKLSTETK